MISEEASTRLTLANKCPLLEFLDTEGNPCDPEGSDEAAYELYRARFAIYLPGLRELDADDLGEADKDKMKSIRA